MSQERLLVETIKVQTEEIARLKEEISKLKLGINALNPASMMVLAERNARIKKLEGILGFIGNGLIKHNLSGDDVRDMLDAISSVFTFP